MVPEWIQAVYDCGIVAFFCLCASCFLSTFCIRSDFKYSELSVSWFTRKLDSRFSSTFSVTSRSEIRLSELSVGLILLVGACFPARNFLALLVRPLVAGSIQIVETDINCFSWWSDSGVRSPSLSVPTLLQVDCFRSEVRAGSA